MEKKQEGFATYLCVQAPVNGYSFEQQMIERNRQLMLLLVQKREDEYYFEIQDKKEFITLFKERSKEYDFVRSVLFGVVTCLEQLQDYMLKPDSVMLTPETIFLDADGQVYLCYVPGYEGNIQKEFCAFMEYLMKYINHREDNLVVLVYGIYHIVREQQYSLLAVRQFMEERELSMAAFQSTIPIDTRAVGKRADNMAVESDSRAAEPSSRETIIMKPAMTGEKREGRGVRMEETREAPIHYQQKKELFKVRKQCIIFTMAAMLLLFFSISLYEAMFIYHTQAQGVSLWLVAAGGLSSFAVAFYKGSRIYKIKRNWDKNVVADNVDSGYNRG